MSRYKGGYQIVKFENPISSSSDGYIISDVDREKIKEALKSEKPLLIDFDIFAVNDDVLQHYKCIFNVECNDSEYNLTALSFSEAGDFAIFGINYIISTDTCTFIVQAL